jgi:hypothetical protein
MKKLLLFLTTFIFVVNSYSQLEATWDQGVPLCPEDKYISGLIDKLGNKNLTELDSLTDNTNLKLFREIGFAFYDKGMYDAADWYLKRAKRYKEKIIVEKTKDKEETKPEISQEDAKQMKKDLEFLGGLPKSYDNLSKDDMLELAKMINNKINQLTKERDSILKSEKPNEELLSSKNNTIKSLEKEKEVIDLTIESDELKGETKILNIEKATLKKYLTGLIIGASVLILFILVLLQRKTIRVKDTEIDKQLTDINKKNKYLEYSARIIRHDMHSGINTYIPRGISSLEKRITQEDIENLKIAAPIKMIKDGLSHTQKVYKRVYEFTNLVKQQVVLDKKETDTTKLLTDYFQSTSYKNQVEISELVILDINDTLFCNAIDNLVKNGLQYNDSEDKLVKIYMDKNDLIVEDNGRGFTQKELETITGKYLTKKGDSEIGLGLSISKTILEEHGFTMTCEKINNGTKIKIKTKKDD